MPGRFFLDSNILLYNFDTDAPHKKDVARLLVKRASFDEEGCISMQVVQECLNVLMSKKRLSQTTDDIRHCLTTILEPLAQPLPLLPLYRDALSIQERWKYGFYDSLIIAAALALECKILYSEDLQHKQKIEGLTIIDPFAEKQ